jgi:EpsI family protein
MKTWSRVAISAGLLATALLVLQLRSTGEAVPLRKSLDAFPSLVGEWRGREATILEVDVLNVLKVKDYLMRRYVDAAGRSLWLYIGYWDTQRKGAQPHSPRNCLPGSGWEPLEATMLTIALPSPHAAITVNRFVIQKEQAQQVVLYWYHSQGQAVAGEVAARVAMVRNAIVRNRTDGSLVRVSSPVYGSVQETSEHLVKYVQAMYPVLAEYLPD